MSKAIAIIGASFRLPGTSPGRFWADMLAGKSLISEVDERRWARDVFLHPEPKHPGTSYTFAAGSLGDVSGFDAAFFGISPREAAVMDPQQRLLLELAWEAMENAGLPPSSLRGSNCGVYIGISSFDYSYRSADDLAALDSFSGTGNTTSIAANRISYVFDLHGPSMALDTACSSALVAFHQARQAILCGETEQAIVGGVSLHLHPSGFISFSKAGMLSKRGRCQVFDAQADGYVRSEGGGVFLLKDYAKARAEGDPILALVAGSAVNTDGSKSGLTVPNPAAQSRLMTQVYRQAGIDSEEIDYLEAHGTGTAVGDPIEARAIGDALGRPRSQPLPIGSIKSNLGHLEAASGVAGLIKAIYSLRHRTVPATIGITTPHPDIDFDQWNIRVVTEPYPLKRGGRLTIGVNSFGFGGANAHVILQSAPEQPGAIPAATGQQPLPLFFSAADPAALKDTAANLGEYLNRAPKPLLYDVAYTARFHREQLRHAAVLFASSSDEAARLLTTFAAAESPPSNTGTAQLFTGIRLANARGPAFVYSGNGAQWERMGKRLLEQSDIFLQTIRRIDRHFTRMADFSLLDELRGNNGRGRLVRTEVAQPVLFATQVGITEMLRALGVEPTAVTGHSVGEVAAAWASGILSLEQAIEVIHVRSMHQGLTRGKGGMTAVGMGEAEIAPLLERPEFKGLSIAGINSSRSITLSGSPTQLTALEALLKQHDVLHKRLDLDYAFHSPAMDEIEAGILADLQRLKGAASQVDFISTVTGTRLEGEPLDAEYWWHNIRKPVQFQHAVETLIEQGTNTFIEIGGHPVLRTYLNDALRNADEEGLVLKTLSRDLEENDPIFTTAMEAWLSGIPIEFARWFPHPGRFVPLPNYPWQRQHLWLPVTSESQGLLQREFVHPLLGYRLAQHTLTWERPLDIQRDPWLADHRVGESVVFPGAGFTELALAAAHQWHLGDFSEIEELEIHAPLVLGESQSKVVRVSIQPEDGRLSIKSRNLATSDQWTEHVSARIMQQPTGLALTGSLPTLPGREPDFTLQQHNELTHSIGLDYGPAFRTIRQGWVEQEIAYGEFEPREQTDYSGYLLHPALLDGAFQLAFPLLRDMLDQQHELAYIPVQLGRVHFRRQAGRPAIAKARILRKAPHSLTAEFSIFDDSGACVALIETARFRAIRLHRSQPRELSFLDYHLTPAPLERTLDRPRFEPQQLQDTLAQIGQKWQQEAPIRRYAEEVEPLLDSFESATIRTALNQLCDGGPGLSSTRLDHLCEQAPAARGLLHYLVSQGLSQGFLEPGEQGWELTQGDTEEEGVSPQLIWDTLVRDYPDYFHLTLPAGRSQLHLQDLLRGTLSAEQLGLTPSARYAGILSDILGHHGRRVIARELGELINAATEAAAPGERLRVLEAVSGSPWFVEQLYPLLDTRLCDYTCFSASEMVHEEAVRTIKHHPLLNFRCLGDTPAAPAEAQHLAIVSLDAKTFEEGRQLLREIVDQLTPGAPLILLGQHRASWIDLVLGASPDWWRDDDASHRSQQVDVGEWQSLLAELGLTGVEIAELGPHAGAGNYLLVGYKPSTALSVEAETVDSPAAAGHWLLLTGNGETDATWADNLSRALTDAGQRVTCSHTENRQEMEQRLKRAARQGQAYSHIVHLAQIGVDPVLPAQLLRCDLVTTIVKACEATATDATCWLLTRGVGETLQRDQDASGHARPEDGQIVADAALWGFGRTLMNEPSNLQVRLLDLPRGEFNPALLQSLTAELLAPGPEQELVLGSQGERYAPRLRYQPAPSATTATETEEPTVKLGFQLPGQLHNLRWESTSSRPPGHDEIEVAVVATGLNFRDVMYTLGLLSDEAIENGFAGPALGLEFAGRVTRVGRDIDQFDAGDAVLGFGPASFGTRVLTRTNAVTRIPENMGFEAAATIPSTFFTAYYALHHLARVQPGEKVLIHGAAGGVGIAALQIAQWLGAEVYATAGSDEKRDFLRLMGVEHIYDSRSLRFADEILEQSGDGGVDVVLNSLAGEAINRNLRVLKPMGRFLELGKRDFYENTRIGLRPFRNNISYFGIDTDQVMQECSELTRRLFSELMTLFQQKILHPLPYTRFGANHVEEAFRFMQQAKQIGKVVVTYDQKIRDCVARDDREPAAGELTLDADGSYLVTGGLGGFGLRSAQWLAGKGARHLILISRSGPASEEARQAIAALEASGVSVLAAACDVTDKAALSALLATCEQQMPRLKGIFHAATVIDDGLVKNLTAKRIRRVLEPKIAGALNLHELTLTGSLDLFVLFSSATTLFGNPGQGSYIAANHWLEALAAQRRALHLPVTCVRWGVIGDVGFLARNPKLKEMLQSHMGGSEIDSSLALATLEKMLLSDSQTLGVLEMNWATLKRFLPTAERAKFREIRRTADDNESGEEHHADIERMLAELPDQELIEAVVEMLATELSKILLIPENKIDPRRSIYDMGLDSLMGVELVVAVESQFGINIPVLMLNEAPTLMKLATYLIEQLREEKGAEFPSEEREIEQLARQHGVKVESLSNKVPSDKPSTKLIH